MLTSSLLLKEMSSSDFLTFLAILLLLQPMVAMRDWNETAILDQICQEVDCGKGTCVQNSSAPFNYVCQCQNGWIRYPNDDNDEYHMFLPCVIPNCTLNYGNCQPAPPPVATKANPKNISIFDPCYWMYCGEGTCTNSGTYRHSCKCNPGYFNLLNFSYYPCYGECTLGSDCANLGIRVSNQQATASGNGGGSQASPFLPWKLHCTILLLMSIAMVL